MMLEQEGAGSVNSFLKATGMSFLYGCKISMRNDHLYRDPECPWDEYIQA